ncbi:tetratricopeptide repeat protein [Sphingomonas pituitosa]|uniref:tetratricopeptide repeat protein n=1 Tax=Sphingomonas pituitosa TaxID=99597 RepID=UPI000AC12BD8|nr:tetratricopeptide repeat protein [Sphingomonas pituitosa]
MSRAEPPTIQFRLKPLSLDSEALKARLIADLPEAAGAIHGAARRGSAAAQLVYAQLLLDGRGVARDPVAALAWFQRAAEQGEPEAWNMIGRCHEKGWGTTQDYVRAIPYFERAIALGHVWAKVNLAQILMRLGDPADRPRARRLFEEAAKAGNLKAINSLARFLEEGWAGPVDPRRAAALYRVAAERGDHWAQFNLATLIYAHGDAEEALAWLDRCIAKSDDGFRGRIAEVLLRQPDDRLRRAGAAALARCVPHTDRPAAYAPRPGGLARFKQAVRRMRPFKPPGLRPVSVQR